MTDRCGPFKHIKRWLNTISVTQKNASAASLPRCGKNIQNFFEKYCGGGSPLNKRETIPISLTEAGDAVFPTVFGNCADPVKTEETVF